MRADSHRLVLSHGAYPADNSDVEHDQRFPIEHHGGHHQTDRMFKDPYTSDGHHFRPEDNSAIIHHLSSPAVVLGSVNAVTEPSESKIYIFIFAFLISVEICPI